MDLLERVDPPMISVAVEPYETPLETVDPTLNALTSVPIEQPIWIAPAPKQEARFEESTELVEEPRLENPLENPSVANRLPDQPKWQPKLADTDGFLPSGEPSDLNRGFPTVGVRAPRTEAPMISENRPLEEDVWVVPESLLEQLDPLAWDCDLGPWSMQVARTVKRLCRVASEDPRKAIEIGNTLNALIEQADRMTEALGFDPRAVKLRRARHALVRRLDIWTLVLSSQENAPRQRVTSTDHERLARCLQKVEMITNRTRAGRAWQKYLEWDSLVRLARPSNISPSERRRIAREGWERLVRTPMTQRQRAYVLDQPFAELVLELQRVAGEPVASRELVQYLESFEKECRASDARLVADSTIRMGISAANEHRRLAQHLNMFYRNANMRIVVTESLLNRLIPERKPEFQFVNDRIGGNMVKGERVMDTKLRLRLISDDQRLRMTLEINGLVSALTTSTSGPATFTNDSLLTYQAWKEIDFSMSGLRLFPARVSVDNDLQLRSVKTDYDRIPLIGFWAQETAKAEHAEKRPKVNLEMKRLATCRAKKQVDREADARLGKLDRMLRQRVFEPLASIGLVPTLIDGQTTKKQMTMRVRLADAMQLGSHTPRPRAPINSLFSVQLHESMFNNILEKLELEGNTFTPAELHQHLAERFPRFEKPDPPAKHEEVTITFPPKDAVHVCFRNGQVIVTLSIQKLSKSPRSWQNFQVIACYRPRVQGRRVVLIHEEPVELIAPMNMTTQIALRGIFSRIFSQRQRIQITPEWLEDDPRLNGIMISQLVLDDGWIGMALSLASSEPHPLVARRRKSRR